LLLVMFRHGLRASEACSLRWADNDSERGNVHVRRLYALANAGRDTRRIQDWLGHRSIQHTTRYTQLSAAPFKDFWR
jgi:integrase